MKTPFPIAALSIAHKDLRAEFRSREIISMMLLFSLLSILIFSFALELDRVAREEAVSGVLWVTVVFSSIIGLNRSLGLERDQGSLDALLLAPIDRPAIFLGKFAGNFIFALTVGLLLLPLITLLYNLPVINLWIIAALILGTFGFSTIGTLLATMTLQTRAREALLPIAMLPIALPILLATVRASTGIMRNAPVSEWNDWLQIVLIIDFVYLVLCVLLFPYVVEE